MRIQRSQRRKQHEKRVARPTESIQPVDRMLRYQNEYSAAAEEGLIRHLMRDPLLFGVFDEMDFTADEFTSPFLAKMFDILARHAADGREIQVAHILPELPGNEASQLTNLLQKPEAAPYGEKSIRDYIEKIRTEKYKAKDPDENLLLAIKKYREQKDVGG